MQSSKSTSLSLSQITILFLFSLSLSLFLPQKALAQISSGTCQLTENNENGEIIYPTDCENGFHPYKQCPTAVQGRCVCLCVTEESEERLKSSDEARCFIEGGTTWDAEEGKCYKSIFPNPKGECPDGYELIVGGRLELPKCVKILFEGQGQKIRVKVDDDSCPGSTPEKPILRTALGCIPTDPEPFIGWVFKLGAFLGGGIAFLLMAWGTFLVMTSTGIPEKLKQGQDIIVSAISGLLFIIFAVFLLRLIGVDILKIPGFT